MNIDTLDKVTSIVSHFTIIFAMTGILIQIKQNWISNRNAFKDQFVGCTGMYIKFQELLLSDDDLAHLNFKIYEHKFPKNTNLKENIIPKQLAMAGIIFQLMENVWLIHDLGKNRNNNLYLGWDNFFEDWMNTKEIAEKWSIMKSHFSKDFIRYVEARYASKIARIKA